MVAQPSIPSTAAPPVGAVVQTAPQQLPPNSPPVAFDGCCPVTLKTLNRWTPGNASFGAIHRGRTYLFAGDLQRQQFLADPDAYSPVFAGFDPVLLLEKQQTVPGTRKFGYKYGGAFYLFSSRETMAKFEASPQTYAAGVRQAMARVDGSVSGVIRR
jgi:YHS domain-containing protein